MNKKVTVYMPTHNRVSLLDRAINSVINQTYKNIQLIICDDASTDKTEDYVMSLLEVIKDIEIVYLKNDSPKGACFSRNRCIEIADGEYITGLDDDDYFLPNRIELFMNAISQSNSYQMVSSNMMFSVGGTFKKWNSRCGMINFNMMKKENIIGNQIFTKTEFYKSLDGFDISFPSWQDYDLWFRMIKKYGECLKINEPTYIMNVDGHRPRITTSGNAHLGYLKFIEKHKADLSTTELKALTFRDKINRHESIKINDLYDNFSLHNLKLYFIDKIK